MECSGTGCESCGLLHPAHYEGGFHGSLCSLPSLLREHWIRAKYKQRHEFTHTETQEPYSAGADTFSEHETIRQGVTRHKAAPPPPPRSNCFLCSWTVGQGLWQLVSLASPPPETPTHASVQPDSLLCPRQP
ncbi:hypothetical protein MC885_000836 [Smutsia gigantea]|nr:hypothetical protein MC885_000836 [Smutsia gigantea]